MVIILVLSAREVGFTAGQWTALIVTTILLAGACVWIIGWGEDEETEASDIGKAEKAEETGKAQVSETQETAVTDNVHPSGV